MQAGLKNAYDRIKGFSETDLTEDLKKIDVPTLIVHGDDDQVVPIRQPTVFFLARARRQTRFRQKAACQ